MAFRFPDRWQARDPGPNPLSEALERRRRAGLPVFDLTLSNPTQAGLQVPEDWTQLLAGQAVRSYDPDPRGGAAAREAIAAYYGERGEALDPGDFFLTAGTSEAYSHLFKLLCEPGDHVLVPAPSYPLLETLAELERISLSFYPLVPEASALEGTRWRLDRGAFEEALTPRTRVVFVVQPNNPTGSVLHSEDAEWLLAAAERRGLALIVDEVFADYTLPGIRVGLLKSVQVPIFTLNGLSKVLGLPQLKLAWIHVGGNPADSKRAQEHLEWICDAYLSVGSAPQAACADLLARRAEFQEPIRSRAAANLATLREASLNLPGLQPLWPQGGWCVPLSCPGMRDDEGFAVHLVETEGVQVHPGYLFGFDEENILVVSLLPEPEVFDEGVKRLCRALAAVI
jgi:alanine-synthesizing transaminase